MGLQQGVSQETSCLLKHLMLGTETFRFYLHVCLLTNDVCAFARRFDTFAPLGPCLVSAELVGNPKDLHLKTILDGKVVQSEGVSDLLFDCETIISYLSQGTTLQKGSVIMTGTPGGVGSSLNPPKYLTPGTVVEVNISKIGTLRNGVEYAS